MAKLFIERIRIWSEKSPLDQ